MTRRPIVEFKPDFQEGQAIEFLSRKTGQPTPARFLGYVKEDFPWPRAGRPVLVEILPEGSKTVLHIDVARIVRQKAPHHPETR
jgi:hypothetical protein